MKGWQIRSTQGDSQKQDSRRRHLVGCASWPAWGPGATPVHLLEPETGQGDAQPMFLRAVSRARSRSLTSLIMSTTLRACEQTSTATIETHQQSVFGPKRHLRRIGLQAQPSEEDQQHPLGDELRDDGPRPCRHRRILAKLVCRSLGYRCYDESEGPGRQKPCICVPSCPFASFPFMGALLLCRFVHAFRVFPLSSILYDSTLCGPSFRSFFN